MGHKLFIKIFVYSFFLLVIIISGCGIKTKFNNADLKWLNVYNEGDTLIFRSEKNNLDTSVIIKKEISYPEYNPVEQHGTWLPQWGVVWYKNKGLAYHPDGDRLISIEKKGPDETFLSINYLYSAVLISNLRSGSMEKYKHGKIYEFETYHPRGEPNQPKKIFWHEDYGIIKYITHDNITWQRINLPKH